MNERRCVLCDQPVSEDDSAFSMTPEAKEFFARQFPGADPTQLLTQSALCTRCASLSMTARSELARDAITREMESYAKDLRRGHLSTRIDIGRTIDSVPLTDEAWEWLNLIGFAMSLAQAQARAHDTNAEWFQCYEDYKQILVSVVAKDINTLGAIFIALRCEWTHQAAALLRTLCERLITLRYIAQDKKARSKLFLGYATVEEYKVARTFLHWRSTQPKTQDIAEMERFKSN